MIEHWRDCEIYSELAYPRGRCSCGADRIDHLKWVLEGHVSDVLDDLIDEKCTKEQAMNSIVEYPSTAELLAIVIDRCAVKEVK